MKVESKMAKLTKSLQFIDMMTCWHVNMLTCWHADMLTSLRDDMLTSLSDDNNLGLQPSYILNLFQIWNYDSLTRLLAYSQG